MKRFFISLSIFITIIGLLITASPYILNLTGLDKPFKKWIIPKLFNGSGSQIDMDRFSLGLGTLNINDVSITGANNSYRLLIKKIELHFYLHELLFSGTKVKKALKRIILREPRLILSKKDTDPAKRSATIQADNTSDAILKKIRALSVIRSISIQEGRIIWKDPKNLFYVIAQNLNGDIRSEGDSLLILNAEGDMFSSTEPNFTLDAQINYREGFFNSQLSLHKFTLNSSVLPADLFPQIHVRDGEIDGLLSIHGNPLDLLHSDLEGKLRLSKLTLDSKDQILSDLSATIQIDSNRVLLQDGKGHYFDQPFEYSLSIANIYKPELRTHITFAKLDITPLNDGFNFSLPKLTFANFNADIGINWKRPNIEAQISAERCVSDEQPFARQISTHINWNPQNTFISNLKMRSYGFDVLASGAYKKDAKLISFSLRGRRTNTIHLILNRLSDARQDIHLRGYYQFTTKNLVGDWSYDLTEKADSVLALSGNFRGSEQKLSIGLLKTNVPDFEAQINIAQPFRKPLLQKSYFNHIPWQVLTTEPSLTDFFTKYTADASVSGTLDNFKGLFAVSNRKNKNLSLKLHSFVHGLFTANKKMWGSIEFKNLFGYYSMDINDQNIVSRLNFPSGINGSVLLDLTKNGAVSGRLNVHDFNPFQIFSDSTFIRNANYEGQVNGTLSLSGSFKDPHLSARLSGDRFILNNIGYYQGSLIAEADKKTFGLDSLSLSLNNVPILAGTMAGDLAAESLRGHFSASSCELQPLIHTFYPANPWLDGTLEYTIDISGTIHQPNMYLDSRVTNGTLYKIPFDQIHLQAKDVVKPGGNFIHLQDHTLAVNTFNFVRDGQINFTADGLVPVDANDSLGVNLVFRGDFLSLLPGWVPFFPKATSNSLIEMSLARTARKWRILHGIAQIDRGELWMRAVAPHVKNISGTIKLEDGTNQVDMINIKGEVDGQLLTINTVRGVVTKSRGKLKPWYFRDLDLDFGILKMTTSGRGVNINLPGIMEPEDFGNLALSGREGSSSFYFAGPVKHPVVYGTVTLYDSRVTYPFISSGKPGAKKSVAVEFLENIDWDVLLKPGEDVVYNRDIPAYIDNVHTELFLDEASRGLAFNGVYNNRTLKVLGRISSSRGRLEYLDQSFKVDHFWIEFNKWDDYPEIGGRAWTTIRDSLGGIPKTIYLKLYGVNKETGSVQAQGRWEDFRFKLESADPQIGETQEQVLAYMGFSVKNIKDKATSVGGAITEKYLIRPLLRPIERVLERSLGLDMVRINSNIARNLFYGTLGFADRSSPLYNPFNTSNFYMFLMQSSELTIGKYLSPNLFLTYTGQLVSVYDKNQSKLNFNHSLGLEYRFFRNVLLEIEYDRELMGYYPLSTSQQYLNDIKIRLRHSFTF